MSALSFILVLVAVFVSFVVSSSVGLGGSLVMVPVLVVAIGTKEGAALAALLLASNNIFKLIGYRATIPWRRASVVIVALAFGAALGASLLVAASTAAVGIAVLVAFAMSLVFERRDIEPGRRAAGPGLAFAAGATSGFSGTSGPLKGVAIRNLGFDRAHFVGAASLASFVGDATKVAVFTNADLLGARSYTLAVCAVPLMAAGTALGRHLNGRVDERGFAVLFWGVMAGYSIRLVTIIA